jgi:ubiquinone/menaquinone biosynthesis C-methylase UbiE
MQPSNTSYEAFAHEPNYIAVNRGLIDTLPLCGVMQVLDLACGTGLLGALLSQRWSNHFHDSSDASRSFDLISLDLSVDQLRSAARGVVEHLPGTALVAAARAEAVPLRSGSFDTLMIGNAIQLFDDKPAAVAEAFRVLRHGGVLAFNTSFYSGTFAPGTERFYISWVALALSIIRSASAERERRGLPPIRRVRTPTERAFARTWLSADEYSSLLRSAGFLVQVENERTIILTRRSLEAIGAYSGLATVLLAGYPVELAAAALSEAAGRALNEAGLDGVPRYWLEMVAVKPGTLN